MEITNASQYPQTFYCRHMQPGTALYEKEGIVLVDTDAMKNLIQSGAKRSIPVYLGHQPVELKNIKEEAVGYVSDSFYNEMDGWAWFKFIAVDDKAHDAIKRGWSVSNAYLPSEMGKGGTKNNVPYKSEIMNGEFTHLAIVPDPRYEGACIMTPDEFKNYQDQNRKKLSELQNSKQEKKPMFKMFKTKKEEVTGSEVDLETSIELTNGKSLTIREMVDAYVENSKSEKSEDQFVMVDGKKVSIAELTNAWEKKNKKMKKNADEEEAEGEEDKKVKTEESGQDKGEKKNKKMKKNADDMTEEDDCMDNSEDDEDEAEEAEKKEAKKPSEKKNSITVEKSDAFFKEMQNAHNKRAEKQMPLISTTMDQIERGKQRYGSDPVKK